MTKGSNDLSKRNLVSSLVWIEPRLGGFTYKQGRNSFNPSNIVELLVAQVMDECLKARLNSVLRNHFRSELQDFPCLRATSTESPKEQILKV